jgi:uncharacterized protein (TIGR02757 family)
MRKPTNLKLWLDEQVDKYERPAFVHGDPIQVARSFSRLQDVEIAAFFSAIIAWGNRKIIVRNGWRLMEMMDGAPFDFVCGHTEWDLAKLSGFVHRTFQAADLNYCLRFLQDFYKNHESLETAFSMHLKADSVDITDALVGFNKLFFSLPAASERTRKHIATPVRKSACKRLCMLLRWLVRPSERGVELGVWKNIKPSQLIIPLDVHVGRVARYLGLLNSKSSTATWAEAVALTEKLRGFDAADPVRYDFALFAAGEDLGKAAFLS